MTSPSPARPRRMGWMAAWLVLTGFVVAALWKLGSSLPDMARSLAGAHLGWLILAVLLNFVGQPLQALAWTRFVPRGVPVRRRAFLQTAGVMAAVSNSVPVFMGGLATGVEMLARQGGLGRPRALAVVSLDQLSEGVAKLALVAVVLTWVPLPGQVALAGGILASGVLILAVFLGLASVRGRDAGGREEEHEDDPDAGSGADAGAGSPWARARSFVGAWARALERLRSPGSMVAGQLLVLGIKAGEALAILAVVKALGADLPIWGVPLALLAVNLSTMVGVTPSNLGVYEGAAFGAWTLAGADAPTALALALLQHAAALVAALGGGWTLATLSAGSARYLSSNTYMVGDRTFHLRDVLVGEQEAAALALADGADPTVVRDAVVARFQGRVSPERIVVLRRAPKVLFLILEFQPGIHPEGDLTLEEILGSFGGDVHFLPRGLTLPVTPKREGERVHPYAPRSRPGRDTPGDPMPRHVVFHFSSIDVGVGDRMVGLASTLVLARALDAQVVLDEPFLPHVFEPGPVGGPVPATGYDLDFLDTRFRYHERLRTSDFSDLGSEIHVIGNECFHYGLYENAHVRHRLGDFDTDLRGAYRDVFRTVLRPRPHILEAVGRAVDALSDGGTRPWVGLQLRTGHLEREFPFHSPGDVDRYCRALVSSLPPAMAGAAVFVSADNQAMADRARDTLQALGMRSHIIDAPVLHVSYDTHRESTVAQAKLFTDLLVLAAAPHLYFSFHSNFGRLAYMLGRSERAFGFHGRNFDLVPLEGVYLASSKHLVYNDAVGAALGGLLRSRYYGERGRLGIAFLVARALPGFAGGVVRGLARRGRVPFREALRLFMDALHRVEGDGAPPGRPSAR